MERSLVTTKASDSPEGQEATLNAQELEELQRPTRQHKDEGNQGYVEKARDGEQAALGQDSGNDG